MKSLIWGVNGQDGSYLAQYLVSRGEKAVGVYRRASTDRLDYVRDIKGLELVEGDITDPFCVDGIVDEVMPDRVYNLAAQSHVLTSFRQPRYTTEVNYLGVMNLVAAMSRHVPGARLYQASTSEMFGSMYSIDLEGHECHYDYLHNDPSEFTNAGTPYQYEYTPMKPNSPYAVAKLASHNLMRIARESGMFACSGILFNHESPRRGVNFVTRKIAKYVAGVAAARKLGVAPSRLTLGNLDAVRDWGFAGDYVKAMVAMLDADSPEDYVIATGEAHTVREFVLAAFARIGVDEDEAMSLIDIDQDLYRPCEVPYLRGDAYLAWEGLGWKPEVTFDGLVDMMVGEELKKVRV